jgi:hypothetical protein
MKYLPAVVIDVVLNENSKYFGAVGGYNGVGVVVYREIKGNTYGALGFAKPYFSNIFNFPLKNELIYIFNLPSPDVQLNINNQNSYYLSPINVWNSPHHNAIPDIFSNNSIPDSQKQDYQQTSLGAVRRVSDGSTEIDLGSTFKEKTNIHPLLKYEGDFVLESRWGQSIRFGSTVISGSLPLNDWSSEGNNGDPIVLIRNGQGNRGSVGFLPILEKIYSDPSSIYLTSNQKITSLQPPKWYKYDSYKSDAPISPEIYNQPQIILNSGRLTLNSLTDHILLSSYKSINLNAHNSINLDTPNDIILESSKVYLGSKDATEKVVLGNTLKTQLDTLITALDTFAGACQIAIVATPGTQIAAIATAATILRSTLTKVNTSNILSDDIYTV